MEVSKDIAEFEKLKEKRKKLLNNKRELNDFDKVLKSMMKVPKPKE